MNARVVKGMFVKKTLGDFSYVNPEKFLLEPAGGAAPTEMETRGDAVLT